jgi:hypothetical protein
MAAASHPATEDSTIELLDAIATHRVADRPDRFEPRQRKHRQKKYERMMRPRNQLKRELLQRVK